MSARIYTRISPSFLSQKPVIPSRREKRHAQLWIFSGPGFGLVSGFAPARAGTDRCQESQGKCAFQGVGRNGACFRHFVGRRAADRHRGPPRQRSRANVPPRMTLRVARRPRFCARPNPFVFYMDFILMRRSGRSRFYMRSSRCSSSKYGASICSTFCSQPSASLFWPPQCSTPPPATGSEENP